MNVREGKGCDEEVAVVVSRLIRHFHLRVVVPRLSRSRDEVQRKELVGFVELVRISLNPMSALPRGRRSEVYERNRQVS